VKDIHKWPHILISSLEPIRTRFLMLRDLAVSRKSTSNCIRWFRCCAFVIHDKKKTLDFSEVLSQLHCEQRRFDLIPNLFAFDLNGAELRKADYASVFRRDEKYVGKGDERFTR